MTEKSFDWNRDTKEACEHIRYMVTSDNDLFVLDMVKRESTEVSKADKIRLVVCPYEEIAFEINPKGTDGVTIGDNPGRFLANEV